jgi:hypothetical protein
VAQGEASGSVPITSRQRQDSLDERPVLLSRSLYLVWAIAIVGVFLAPVVVLSVSGRDAQGIEELYAGGLIAAVLVSALFAYQIEARKRYVYELRSHALDLISRVAAGSVKVDAIDEVRSIECALIDCGAYTDVAVVADARRQTEALDRQGSNDARNS